MREGVREKKREGEAQKREGVAFTPPQRKLSCLVKP